MKKTGIITEFNPFHNGHKYIIEEAIEKTSPDCLIIIMSGNYVQRGEPAIIDKWHRAEAAIKCGANLVIELPVFFSVKNAEIFSKASLYILNKFNIDYLCFGSESENIEIIKNLAEILAHEPYEFKRLFKKHIGEGVSYPKAISLSLEEYCSNPEIENVFKPNNTLGLEYIKNIYKYFPNIVPVNIKRIGSDYHSVQISGKLSSATAVRKALINSDFESVKANVPDDSYKMIMDFYKKHGKFITLEDYFDTIRYLIISRGPEQLKNIYDIGEGLENKLFSNAGLHNNLVDFILSVKSKRYTYSRIRRILLNILLDLQKHDDDISCMEFSNISILAADKKGLSVLNSCKDSCRYITKKSDYKESEANVLERHIKELTERSDMIYYMKSNSVKNPVANAFTNNIRIIDK